MFPGKRTTMVTLEKNDCEFVSADYEEDGYLEYVKKSDTPSFDKEDPPTMISAADSLLNSISTAWSATNFVIADDDEDGGDSCTVETEFIQGQNKFTKNNSVKDVRVKFQDLSKPYLARITNNENYMKFLHLVKGW